MKEATQHTNSFRDGCLISAESNPYLHLDFLSVPIDLVHVKVSSISATLCVTGVSELTESVGHELNSTRK